MGRLDEVRHAAAEVAKRARLVRVREDLIAAYARSLPLDQARRPDMDREHHFFGSHDDTLAFVVTLDAVNFGSGYFPRLRKRDGLSGYFTVASSLKRRFVESGPMSPRELLASTPMTCAALFDQDPANGEAMELMELFARAWSDLGLLLLERYDGRFSELVGAAAGSAEALVDILRQMPFFEDVSMYAGFRVPLWKRAQITAADLAIALEGQGLGRFDDLDRLTIFADNLVPHVLRIDGVLEFDADVVQRIEREELLTQGSPEEVEIRACAVHAVELMAQSLRAAGESITSAALDQLLWTRGGGAAYKARPRHRARCVYY